LKKVLRMASLLVAIAAIAVLIFTGQRFLREERIVDDCLSAKHGSFDYSTMSCDLNENHPYVPYHIRHPHDGSLALVAVVALLAGGVGMRGNKHLA
jgi:hypothetical protein